MRYLPAIDVWQPGISDALQSGQLRLQPGQWIKCGTNEKGRCSRFAYASKGYIRAYHYPDASRKFLQYVETCREHSARKG
jgi:hypothetical protein